MSTYRIRQEGTTLNPDRRFLLRHIAFDKTIVRAAGHYLYDEDGVTYFDALSQYGALPFGHNPPQIWTRLEQVRRNSEPSFVQPLFSSATEFLAQKLLGMAPANAAIVTFCNSGAEAAEAAIKLARARTQRRTILSIERGFHGKTLGALSATGSPLYKDPFLLDTTHFQTLPFGDVDALAGRLRRGDVAAFMVESIQGEGGMRVQPEGYLAAASELCKECGTLLVLDEVQSGLGRSGHLFGFLREPGIEPDVILLAKALGGGLVPLGAMLCTADAWSEAFGMLHSSTFANSHLTCSVGCAAVDEITADDCALVERARKMGIYLSQRLQELVDRYPKAYAAASGAGLMQGLLMQPWETNHSYFTAHCSYVGHVVPLVAGFLLNEQKILTAPVFNHKRTLRLEPALTVTREEIDGLVEALADTGDLIQRKDYVQLLGYLVKRRRRNGKERLPAPNQPVASDWPGDNGHRRGSFAFLIHPTDEAALLDTLPPEFAGLDAEERGDWRKWMHSWFSRMWEPSPVFHADAIHSKQGGYVEGWLVACPLTPMQMLRLSREERAGLLQQYLSIARNLGVDVVGLGAFVSIISDGGRDILDQGATLTTGNSLTALSSAESVMQAAAWLNRDPVRMPVAVIGAAGSVGRLTALHFASLVEKVVLVGNAQNRRALDALWDVAGEIYARAIDRLLRGAPTGVAAALSVFEPAALERMRRACDGGAESYRRLFHQVNAGFAAGAAPLEPTVDVNGALQHVEAVVSASSAGKSFIDPARFRPGTIVCDTARPLDVLNTVSQARPDVYVYEGGVMRLPEPVSFGHQNILGYPRGMNLACLSETIVLAMEGVHRSYSVGNRIDYEEALWVHRMALAHGFTPYMPESLLEHAPSAQVAG